MKAFETLPGSTVRARLLVRAAALGLACTFLFAAGCASGTKPAQQSSKSYAFWPVFPAEPRIQFVSSYQYSSDVEPERSDFDRLIYGDEKVLPINKPYGVEMGNGKIYVCDTRNAGVLVLDLIKHQTRVMGATGMGSIGQPADIAIADDGAMYVTDFGRNAIRMFNADERHVTSFGFEGAKCAGIAVHGNELYVTDLRSQRVLVLDRFNGELLRAFGEKGDQDGQFVWPLGIAVDDSGHVYVTDVIRCRVQKFTPDGKLLDAFGTIGDNLGSFVRPKHIAIDHNGYIYVIDAAIQNVQMFNQEQKLLMFFGSAGSHPGSMKLPAGICVNNDPQNLELFSKRIHPAFKPECLIVVTNQFGSNKVAVYAMGQLREGKTVQDLAPVMADVKSGVQDDDATPAIEDVGGATDADLPENNVEEPETPDEDGQQP